MKRTTKTTSPAIWERWLSALVLLSMIIVVPPVAILLGGATCLVFRKTHRHAAFHGLQAAIWQISFMVLLSATALAFIFTHTAREFIWFYGAVMNSPEMLVGFWTNLSVTCEVLLVLVGILLAANILVSIGSAIVVALSGRIFSVPLAAKVSRRICPL